MKIICDGADLSDAVLKVSKGTSNKTTNPILEGIKVVAEEDYVTLSATDLELSIEKTIKGMVQIEGEMVVPGKFFCEYIKKLNNEQIELHCDEKNMLSIKYTDSVGKIQCLNAQEFPEIKKFEDSPYFEMKSKDLKSLIAKSIYAVAVEDVRPILKGVKLEITNEKVTAVALDGYRLAVVKKPVHKTTAEFSCIVPARSLNEISKLLDDSDNIITVFVGRNFLMVDIDNTKITTRLLEGDFINYTQIIPSDFTTNVVLNKDQLLDALERASLLSRVDRNNLVKFEIADKVMVLSSKSEIGDIKENITISLSGNDLSIAFNARYFTEALRVLNDEFLKLQFTSSVSPCIITSNDTDEFLFLILPVRIMA
ncbi:MAG: DNA polymerase III subunit beta [Clostridiales bacterium]|nr:DNA polymerase III subunit beta [Clostridiales bacterium]